MNTHKRLKLSMAISGIGLWAFCNSALAQQQVSEELDITISVIEQGETPAGFVNRLALPSLETLNSTQATLSSTPQIESVDDITSDVNEIVDVATSIGTDTIRETISIDGTTNVNVEVGGSPVISLPGNIVDILDPASPLQNTLQDTADQVTGIVDSLSPTLPTAGLDVASDAVANTQLDAIVDNLEPSVNAGVDSAVQGILQEQISQPLDEIPVLPNETPLPLENIGDELREVPLL